MSAILRLVKQNTWDEVLSLMQKKHIRVSESYEPRAIFNYEAGCDFADPVVCEARGIIIDKVRKEIVLRTPGLKARGLKGN